MLTIEWGRLEVQDEAVVVVDVRAVDPFHVSGGVLVVHGLRGVGGEGGLPAHLAYLAWVPLHMVNQKPNHSENINAC